MRFPGLREDGCALPGPSRSRRKRAAHLPFSRYLRNHASQRENRLARCKLCGLREYVGCLLACCWLCCLPTVLVCMSRSSNMRGGDGYEACLEVDIVNRSRTVHEQGFMSFPTPFRSLLDVHSHCLVSKSCRVVVH